MQEDFTHVSMQLLRQTSGPVPTGDGCALRPRAHLWPWKPLGPSPTQPASLLPSPPPPQPPSQCAGGGDGHHEVLACTEAWRGTCLPRIPPTTTQARPPDSRAHSHPLSPVPGPTGQNCPGVSLRPK